MPEPIRKDHRQAVTRRWQQVGKRLRLFQAVETGPIGSPKPEIGLSPKADRQ